MSGAGSSSSCDADEALRSTTGKANFQRVTRLLISGGTRLLRDTFDFIHPPSILSLRLNDPAVKKALKAAKLTKPQWGCLYPSPGVYGESTDFDITLLSRLFRTICLLSPPPTGWDDLPNSTDHSLTADLVRVKFYRNSVYGHVNENMEIPDDDFPCLWKEISEVLLRIAGNISRDKSDEWQKALNNFLKDPLTPEDERNVDELMRWYANDMDVKKSIEELKSASVRLEEGMSQLLGNTPRTSSSGSPSEGVHLHLHIGFGTTTQIQAMLEKLAMRCLTVDSSKQEELNGFIEYLQTVLNVLLVDVQLGSIHLTVECRTLQILEGLWEDYSTGHLNEMAQKLLVTADTLREVGLLAVKIKTTIQEEEYIACKEYFLQKSGRAIKRMNPIASANHLGMMARTAMQLRNYAEALQCLSMGLAQLPSYALDYAAPFLVDRAECFWQIGNIQASLEDMKNATHIGLPMEGPSAEEEAFKWSNRGFFLYRKGDFLLAERCCSSALCIRATRRTRGHVLLCRALARLELGNNDGALRDAGEVKSLDVHLAKAAAQTQKDTAIRSFQSQDYQRALKGFDFTLALHPEDVKFKRSIVSHQIAVYFKMKQYKKALELGQESPSYKSKEEAERWKERGNRLFKENSFDLAIAYYAMAIKYTPFHEKDLKGTIHSNRSLVYKRQGKDEEALKDAKECVDNKPGWSKGQYRLGSSLFALKKYSEALQPFTRSLQLMLQDTKSSENDQVDTLMQIVSVALEVPDSTSRIKYPIPKNVIQRVIDKAVAEKDWARLHLLFLGGGGPSGLKRGEGGIAIGCDASSVPLEEAIRCRFSNREKFISVLANHNAKLSKKRILEEGLAAARKGEDEKAIDLLSLSLNCEETTIEKKREGFQRLCDLYFKRQCFQECLEAGQKLKATFGEEKDKAIASQWKNWGNELHKEKKFDLMAEYYSLAIEFTPESNTILMTALLSNRSLAFVNLNKYEDALADATQCIRIRPQWFRGHSRLANCLVQMERKEEALKAFCAAHNCAHTDREKQATAQDLISTAMSIDDGEYQISGIIPPEILKHLVKDATEKKDWITLRFLYLGTPAKRNSRGPAYGCDASEIPLELVIASEVEDLHRFVSLLIERGASPSGRRGCTRHPLVVAMEKRKFPLAVTLLKKGADPSCVVGQDTFINKEWLQLGRRALDYNDNTKALMLLNMAFHLSDVISNLAVLQQILHALSEAHFRLNEHEKCVEAGKECFKLKSVKSEEERQRWEVRANHSFDSENYHFCIEYINMALKYLPADKKRTFSRLLCKRSAAHEKLKDLSSALADAKSASRMDPNILEAYLRQLNCFRALENQKEAMQAIIDCLRLATDKNTLYGLLNESLEIARNLEEGTSALTVAVPEQLVTKLVNNVVRRNDWHKLRILYLGGGGPNSHPVGEGGLATGIEASMVPLGPVLRSSVPEKLLFISALLRDGASPNLISGSDVIPLEGAMQHEDGLPLVEKLIHHGANPCVKSDNEETVIHQALRIGLKSGNFRFLKAMMRSKHPEIENVQDDRGNTLYHLTTTGKKCTQNKRKAMRILRDANVNPNLPNKKGDLAVNMVSKSDERWKMVSMAIQSYRPNTSPITPSTARPENEELGWGQEQVPLEQEEKEEEKAEEVPTTATSDDGVSSTPSTSVKEKGIDCKQQQREEMRNGVSMLIENLSVVSLFSEDTKKDQEDTQRFSEPWDSVEATETFDEQTTEETSSVPAEEMTGIDSDDPDSDDHEENGGIDFESPFENLPWEVDCTDRVWKIMRSKRVGNVMRKRIIDKIRMLANGRWSKTLCKRLEGVAKKEDILLYELKLTKSHRIIWERTIAFSGRCSDDPELRLNTENPEGRIYSDIIRVWDIVLDHDALSRAIDRVVKSHDRGMDCIIKKKLKGIAEDYRNNDSLSAECFPNKYAELSDLALTKKDTGRKDLPKEPQIGNKLPHVFFPPASANDQDYHILKFYSFSTALVNTILENDVTSKIDFPFKITELEHAIVNLRPQPPSPIILLGRSGTGKTTCCLYRLWDSFQKYWENASTAGPHLPKYRPPTEAAEGDDEDGSPVAETSKTQEASKSGADEEVLASESREPASCYISAFDLTKEDSYDVHDCFGVASQLSKPEKGFCDEGSTGDDIKEDQMYEHLHQVFITKNTVLCNEVEENFKELCRACPATRQRVQFEDQAIPARIQDVDEEAWPLFVSSREWLLMLDASLPGKPFFCRTAEGRLLRKIDGWGEDDNHLQFIPVTDSDEEDSDEEDEDDTEATRERDEQNEGKPQNQDERDPRTEITYQVFKATIWPKMKTSLKEKVDYHPTLVWTEIRSFIKGSAEALLSDNGVLTLEEYESLGKKMAPNFSAKREIVYKLFKVYQRVRSSSRMFDEADLVFNLHQRLQRVRAPEWSTHQFYVDETQDFTQAELSLLIRCCRFPNSLFFTGDTAQSIMRGIAFRFKDLTSLFHHAKMAAAQVGGHEAFIAVPEKRYQLTHNYRSHAGILRLASSIVNLLVYFFPESFDRLEKDQGLFEGPKPVLLESCSLPDLAMILRGNRRQSSRIEFGAHQVVLVASNEARETMPEELKQGLVMTIYEAKGLEFDDVLIYNFFKDSQALKEWRVVTSFTEERDQGNPSMSTGLVELTEDSLKTKASRPLKFDHEKHKVLNSEFKNLYTAITRARVNVWFFDEDKEARAPMFEYFHKLSLVRVVALEADAKDSSPLASMFAAKSTPEEWRKGGMKFYKNRLWQAAIQCFTFAGDELMLQKSQAQLQAAEANKLRVGTNRQQMWDAFLRAAEGFLKCGMHDEAEICLHNSREWILLAELYKKTGKFKSAARLFKRKRLFVEASQCYESQSNYAEAIEVLCHAGHYEEALGVLERFNSLSISGSIEDRQGIIPPKATRTVERLRFQLADQHFQSGKVKEMEEVLQRLPTATDRITFLKKRGCIIEAARAMADDGRRDDAARLLSETGKFKEAIKYSRDPKFAADCLMASARTSRDEDDVPKLLEQALERYQQCGEVNGQAEALLMLGRMKKDAKAVQEARRLFDKSNNCCGEVESVSELLNLTNFTPPANLKQWIIVRALERALWLTASLYKPAAKRSMKEQMDIGKCEDHFALCKTDVPQQKLYLAKRGGRFAEVDPGLIGRNASETRITIDTVEAHLQIGRFLVSFASFLVQKIRKMLETTLSRNSICSKITEGTVCGNADCAHPHKDSGDLFNGRFEALFNLVYLESVVERFTNDMASSKDGKEVSTMLVFDDFRGFHSCQCFCDFLSPASGFRETQLTVFQVDRTRKHKAVNKRLSQFVTALWRNVNEEKRRSDTDNFLRASFCLQLIGSGPRMATWICEEEKEFEKKARKSQHGFTNLQLVKNGMVAAGNWSGKNRYESYLQWWEDGKRRLYVYGDVENAAHFVVRRFLTLTAKRGGMTRPSIANTVMILEHQLTSCLALFTRLCTDYRYPICLPASYLTMVKSWDNLWGADQVRYTMYQAVENNASQEPNRARLLRSVQSILSHMVKLTCGDVASLFDVLGDAVGSKDSPKYCASGEAERALILVLTMLCNCAKGVPHTCDEVVLRNVWRIDPQSCLPSCISTVLEDMKGANGTRDAVKTLKRFLQRRGEELCDLRWHSGRLWTDGPSNPGNYPDRFSTNVSYLREEMKDRRSQPDVSEKRPSTDSREVDQENAEDLNTSTETTRIEYTEEELRDKEKARLEVNVTSIQRWLRRMKSVKKLLLLAQVLRERRLKRAESREEQAPLSKLEEEAHFIQFRLDSSACGICGTNFEVLAESVPFASVAGNDGNSPENSEGREEEYPPKKDQLERSTSLNEKPQNFEAHVESSAHSQKEHEFRQYKDLYLKTIHSCFTHGKELRTFLTGNTRESRSVGLDLEQLEGIHSTITTEMQRIESSRDWSSTGKLAKDVKEYESRLQGLDRTVEQVRNAGNDTDEEEEADEPEVNEEDEDDDLQPIKEVTPQEGKKKGKRNKRQRKKGRKN